MGKSKFQMAEVEVVPWLHNIGVNAHESVIEFIRSLPRNSTLCMETTEKELMKITRHPRRALDDIVNRRGKHMSNPLAFFEVVHECMKRNIQIVPLESPILRAKALKAPKEMSKDSILEGARISIGRDNAFARATKTQLSTFKGEKLPALVALGHAAGVDQELNNLGIKSRINTTIFSQDRGVVESIVELYGEMKAEVLRSNKERAFVKYEEIGRIPVGSERKGSVSEHIGRMVQELYKRERVARERLAARKLAHNPKQRIR